MSLKAAVLALIGLGALVLALMLLPAAPSATKVPVVAEQKVAPEQTAVSSGFSSDSETRASRTNPSNASEKKSAALTKGVASANSRDREKSMAQLALRLASLPPQEALARIGELPDQDSRDMAMLVLLGEWSGLSSLDLIRRGDVWRFGAGGALAVHLLDSGKITPDQAAAIVQQNTDGNRRGELFMRVGAKLASEDPAAAVALGNGLEGWERQRFLEGLAGEWSDSSPEEARRWISTVNDAGTRDALLAGLLQAEARRNPATAAANFSSLPPSDDSARARAAMRIASDWASRDTVAAMQWAKNIPGEAERNAAQQGIQAAAPVGIGAMLTRGPEGLPVVGSLVPGGPASASGALQTGDQLLAVTDGNGGWVDTRNLRTRELLSLVRGDPNTQVSLQVLSPGSSAPRTVTLGRQQLIFRPQ